MQSANHNFLNQAVYITMPDNVKIAADIWLPPTAEKNDQFPLIIEFTRYWRIAENGEPKVWVDFFKQQGFAYARIDCRGSGASFGVRGDEHSVGETQDFRHIINWFTRQPWSNGAMATTGISYGGNTAELAMIDAPGVLLATIPRFTDFDVYATMIYPGGLPNTKFLIPWGNRVKALDRNSLDDQLAEEMGGTSVKPIDNDSNKALLKKAVEEHKNNYDIVSMLEENSYQAVFRDDKGAVGSLQESRDSSLSPHLAQNNIRLKDIPSYHWASFNDAGTAQVAIARFMCSGASMKVVIGYWT